MELLRTQYLSYYNFNDPEAYKMSNLIFTPTTPADGAEFFEAIEDLTDGSKN